VAASRRNTSQRLTLVILVLASITAITLDYRGESSHAIGAVRNGARDVLSPVQRLLSDALRPVGDFFSGAVNYGSAVSENTHLESQLGALKRQALENATAEQQLQEILSEQHLPYVENIPTVLATVITGATSNFELTFEIDRGTSSGVGKGMPVVAGAGLVGTVASAGSSTAMVEVITDPRSSVSVRFGRPGSLAIADGQGGSSPLALSGVTANMSPHVGETVYTSGITGAAVPAGIPVGTVTSVHYTSGLLTKSVLVKPLAELDEISYVTVLQWLPAP
jgi:rod shape-determining protein MreC